MKNKLLLKITSVVIIICIIATIFIPFSVKSAQTTLTNMQNTGRGIGNTSVWKTTVKGYNNSYCVEGGSSLYTGAQLNDKGNFYSNSFTDITSKRAAVSWLLDNIYLAEGTDSSTKSDMKTNLKNIMKEYAAKKDSSGKSYLAKAVGKDSISNDWINKAVDEVIKDTNTLYAVNQYLLWDYVNNASSSYTNALQNSNGSYNKIPNATADKQYYIAYYVTLNEMAKSAQKNNYVSPNSSGKYTVSLEKDSSAKVTRQSNKKIVLMGPYKLKNNHNLVSKTLSATVTKGSSSKTATVQAVDANGKAVDLSSYTGKFYFKVTYSEEFSKGTTYKIKVNIALKGYKTFANVLYPSGSSKQPLISVRKEKYTETLSSELKYDEEIKGKYSLEIYKVGKDNKALSGAKFSVKEGSNTAKTYGPSNSNGIISVVSNKEIKKAQTVSYTISEVSVGNNCVPLAESFKVNVKLEAKDEEYKATKVTFDNNKTSKSVKLKDGTSVTVSASISGNTVRVTVPNGKIEGSYSIDIAKKDENGKALSGVTFSVQDGSNAAKNYGPTGSDGKVTIANKTITAVGTDSYTIKEIKANDDYITLKSALTIYVTKATQNYKFVVSKVSFDKSNAVTSKQVELKDGSKVTVKLSLSNNKITVTIPNKKIEGNYSLELLKVDENNKALSGVNFKVQQGSNAAKTYTTNASGIANIVTNLKINSTGVDEYTIKEVSSKNNQYITLKDEAKVYVTKKISNYKYVASNVSFEKDKVVTSKEVSLQNGEKVKLTATLKNGKITITVPNNEIKGNYSLNIKKIELGSSKSLSGATFKVQEGTLAAKTYGPTGENGIANITTNKAITAVGTDEYTVSEVAIDKDYVTLKDSFKIYITKEIKDYKYVASKVSFEKEKEVKTKQLALKDGSKVTVTVTVNDGIITITVPNKKISGNYSLELEKVNSENASEKLEGVTFKVQDGTNVAKEYGPTDANGKVTIVENKEITGMGTDEYTISEIKLNQEDYEEVKDNIKREGFVTLKESFKLYITKAVKDNSFKVTNVSFENGKEVKTKKVTLEDGTKVTLKVEIVGNTVKVTIPNKPITKQLNFDMALRKYISKVTRDGKEINIGEDRTPVINEFSVKEYEENKTAGYYHTKNPVTVKPGDTVLYTLRVYNEGDIAGFAKEITDYLPQGLEYVEDSIINKENNWVAVINEDGTTTVKTSKLNDTLIKPANGVEGLSEYAALGTKVNPEFSNYVQIECKVKKDVKDAKLLVNVAEITNYGYNNDAGEYVEADKEKVDIDSEQNNVFTKNENTKNIDEYYEKVVVPQIKETNKNYKGIQDDDDFENIYVEIDKDFDLALRKFITSVTKQVGTEEQKQTDIINRIPTFRIDENGKYVYEHTKEPLVVANGNIVTYTLRVYNEGDIDGYAKLIKDDIPEGLEFLPDEPLNKVYRWVILDKNGKETTNVKDAVYVVSDYLSKEQEKSEGENLIKAFNKEAYEAGEIKEPYYKEVKVSFKVNKTDKFDEIVINQAQISKHSDKDGNDITDKDSTPDKWIDGEDDQDIEKVKVQYFDLSLRKWVTKAITTENGVQTVSETGHKAEDDPEQIVKVDLKESNINNVTVKFEYSIRVKNEGQIAGYAKEITDYIPEGLKFVKADNPDWQEIDGKVVTEKLKDKLLQPGETQDVTILLTWINDKKNMGLKVNTAEISKDYNEEGSPDIDSTPGNKVPGEDDIDDAPVMLTVKTGQEATYIALAGVVLVILSSGVVLIKKYVLK